MVVKVIDLLFFNSLPYMLYSRTLHPQRPQDLPLSVSPLSQNPHQVWLFLSYAALSSLPAFSLLHHIRGPCG